MSYEQKMENTLLELGAEVYRLKHDLLELKEQDERIFAILHGVKQLLDEKGLIFSEDFEDAAQLGEAMTISKNTFDASIDVDAQPLYKKNSH